MELSTKTPRIEVVDALRGFAVMAILLVHNLYNPQIEMFARFKTKSSFHKTKRII